MSFHTDQFADLVRQYQSIATQMDLPAKNFRLLQEALQHNLEERGNEIHSPEEWEPLFGRAPSKDLEELFRSGSVERFAWGYRVTLTSTPRVG
jgi:hypothetical protein